MKEHRTKWGETTAPCTIARVGKDVNKRLRRVHTVILPLACPVYEACDMAL